MSSGYYNPIRTCPICEEKTVGLMNKGEWYHRYMVCSDECGEYAKSQLYKLQNNKEYVRITKLKEQCELSILQLEASAVNWENKPPKNPE